MSQLTFQLCLVLSHVLVIQVSSQNDLISPKRAAMFVFGDSLYDCGNNDFLNVSITSRANFPPYGESYFIRPTGRFSDGRNVPDFAALYLNLPLWRPYLDPESNYTVGANFASAGAQVLSESTSGVLNLVTQLRYLKDVASWLKEQLGEEAAKELLSNAIYLSSLGGVDYKSFGTAYPNATESELKAFVTKVIDKLADATKEMYQLGGRKFAFQNLGSVGCDPEAKQSFNITDPDECVEILQLLAIMHNEALSKLAQELETGLTGFKYMIFDFFNALMNRTMNPTKYGFEVANYACCGTGRYRGENCGRTKIYELCSDPKEFVFFDGAHNTEACNIQLAELLWNGTTDVAWPINLRQLYELDVSSDFGPLLADQ